MFLLSMLSITVGAATYLYAKKNRATTTTAAVAGLATGAGTAATLAIAGVAWPVLIVAGLPYAAYRWGKSEREGKALRPGT